ncbi:unnamed protein product [Dovyalis caffra]|uniref:Uncharacterized protein n=1 Tax=Dovyalis caffra TaxID=77055 RepID=A0AAV1R0E5_9ROSI|nr:unnamed protein product [Dovyalis caffra]
MRKSCHYSTYWSASRQQIGELAPTNNNRKMISAKRGVTYRSRGLEATEKYRARVKSRPAPRFPSLFSCLHCTPHLSLL